MLKKLRIKNIVLIEEVEIVFDSHFNVLTGETGAGKSAIMNALSLVAGERTDATMLRHGADKGIVEAVFDIGSASDVLALLEEAAIEHQQDEELIITREVTTSKSRGFVNHQQVQAAFLKRLCSSLFNVVGQHANQKLFALEAHREILDLFGDLQKEAAHFAKNWHQELTLKRTVEEWHKNEAGRVRELEICQTQLEELESARLKAGEDAELFSEYSLLSHVEEIMEKSSYIHKALQEERAAIVPSLRRLQPAFERLVQMDPKLGDLHQTYTNTLYELEEIAHALRNSLSRLEQNPEKFQAVSQRLDLIEKLKKKYGPSLEDVFKYQLHLSEKVKQLQQADEMLEGLQTQIERIEIENQRLSAALTKRRKEASKLFEKAVLSELHSLNMAKAQFHCAVEAQTRTAHGEDRIEFFLAPNVGEKQISVRDAASGGELSRLFLAIQTIMAGKEQMATIVFDEVDANVGGETAAIVGEKLLQIAQRHQVICITHFPQVAEKATHHLQIFKEEDKGRTFTRVALLNSGMKQEELLRMAGKSRLAKKS